MKKLVLETTAPFQGLPELVADKEGLFAKEGLTIEWVERESDDKSTKTDVNSPKGLDPFSSHGKMLEQGKADLYNACECGNYSRVGDTHVASRQVGRRSIVTFAALLVRGCSPVQTPQQLAGRQIGVLEREGFLWAGDPYKAEPAAPKETKKPLCIKTEVGWQPKVPFAQGVKIMRDNIEYWRDAPVWTGASIAEATTDWFRYPGAVNNEGQR